MRNSPSNSTLLMVELVMKTLEEVLVKFVVKLLKQLLKKLLEFPDGVTKELFQKFHNELLEKLH